MKKKRGTITAFWRYLKRLSQDWFGPYKPPTIADWLLTVEKLIGRHSGPKATSGPTKGHSETDTAEWMSDLYNLVERDIRMRNKGRLYDGNMAIASQMGLILVAWYMHVHRAKSYDPNRPVKDRKQAAFQRTRYAASLFSILVDDSVMGEVFGRKQKWNFPFGKGAKGGRFR